MKTRNTIEDDLDRVRECIHEETKGMTPVQRMERTRENFKALAEQSGYKLVPHGLGRRLVKIQPEMTPQR